MGRVDLCHWRGGEPGAVGRCDRAGERLEVRRYVHVCCTVQRLLRRLELALA